MDNNKLQIKDLVNIGIFSALYMVITMIAMIPAGFSPIIWILWPALAGLLGGAFFTLLMAKVQKPGTALLLIFIVGLIYFAIGECTWTIVATCAAAGILAEVPRKLLGYNTFSGMLVAGGLCAMGLVGSPLPMWLFKESYMKSIIEMGMGEDYVASMKTMISTGSLLGMLLAAFIGGAAGVCIGRLLLKKHFEKAGII